MKLEKCPWCGSGKVMYNGCFGVCNACGALGPDNDPNAEKWNAFSRRVHGQTKHPDSGPMPWRLQIAAGMWASCFADPTYSVEKDGPDVVAEFWFELADALIAAHRATEKGGAA